MTIQTTTAVRWEHCGGAGNVPFSSGLQKLLIHWKKRGVVSEACTKIWFSCISNLKWSNCLQHTSSLHFDGGCQVVL